MENSPTISIKIRCKHCNIWFKSAIWFDDRKSFDTSALIGNMQECPVCHQMTGCDKDNFKARFADGGFIGVNA